MSFAKATSLESQPPSQSSRAQGNYTDDPAFQDLSVRLSEKLFSLTSNTNQLSRQISLIGTKRETERVRERIQSLIEASSDGFKDVGDGLKKIRDWPDALSPQQRYTQGKLTSEFQSSLGEFQVLQQTALSKQREARTALESGAPGDFGSQGAQGAQGGQQQQQQQQLVQLEEGRLADQSEVDFQQSLIIERESEIRQIEQSVGELNELFRDVATMVTHQGETLDLINTNIENTRDDTRGADQNLTQASRYQRNARSKACCLLLILAVILIVVILAATVG